MWFIPYDRFILQSQKAPDELKRLLEHSIAERKLRLLRRPEEPFFGKVSESEFKLRRTGMVHSQVVQLHGRFLPVEGGVQIKVLRRPRVLFLVFGLVYVVTALGAAAATFWYPEIWADAEAGLQDPPAAFAFIWLIFAAWIAFIFLYTFWDAATGTKHLLKLIFSAEEV